MRQSKYISNLLDHAAKRRAAAELVQATRASKLQKTDDVKFGNAPKYVTSSYKQKLVELEKWKQDEIFEEENSSKRMEKGLSTFMANIWGEKLNETNKKEGASIEIDSTPIVLNGSTTEPETSTQVIQALANQVEEMAEFSKPLEIEIPKAAVEESSNPVATLEEKTMSARERYLQRKKMQ